MTVDWTTLTTLGVPAHLHDGLRLWIEHGQPPGSFLSAVLLNDLAAAVAHADPESLAGLRPLLQWLHWEAPTGCHRDPDVFRTWPAKLQARAQAGEFCDALASALKPAVSP